MIFGDEGCSADVASSELEACLRVAADAGIELRSFVFPRNVEGHHDVLRAHGIRAFRGAEPYWYRGLPGPLRRAAHLADEAIALTPPVSSPAEIQPGLWDIPGSMLLLSRVGVRRLVPIQARVRKARKGLRRAVREDKVFHLWFHPFNLAVDRGAMLAALDEVLQEATRLRSAGQLTIRLMGALADELAEGGRTADAGTPREASPLDSPRTPRLTRASTGCRGPDRSAWPTRRWPSMRRAASVRCSRSRSDCPAIDSRSSSSCCPRRWASPWNRTPGVPCISLELPRGDPLLAGAVHRTARGVARFVSLDPPTPDRHRRCVAVPRCRACGHHPAPHPAPGPHRRPPEHGRLPPGYRPADPLDRPARHPVVRCDRGQLQDHRRARRTAGARGRVEASGHPQRGRTPAARCPTRSTCACAATGGSGRTTSWSAASATTAPARRSTC